MLRCDYCDLLIGAGCACSRSPQPPPGESAEGSGATFPSSSILISPTRYAHRPGCGHLSDSAIHPPEWGWITGADPHLWTRIAQGHAVYATEGNPQRYAVRRCTTCEG
ncbi:hypothetical protein EKD16_10060 [Streptomonospora litoralis]|uniref:Uncharacterized protein n=1 Tax=Streptomonospora litoralis TaxID=2498135 RepID=A0A4P6Q4E0_9ACTN|nr:hypothetical protein EKD16_10060 [Streptomonospora litoralis]